MNAILGFILILAIGYAGSQISLFQQRFSVGVQSLFLSGVEFLFIGLLLGPNATNVLSEESLRQLTPILSLGLGWIGLLIGLQFDQKIIVRIPVYAWKMATTISLLAFFLFFGLFLLSIGLFFQFFSHWNFFPEAILAIQTGEGMEKFAGIISLCFILGWIGSVSTYTALALVQRSSQIRGDSVKLLQYLTDLRAPLAIMVLGMGYALFHVTGLRFALNFDAIFSHWPQAMLYFGPSVPPQTPQALSPVMPGSLWLVVTVLLGIAMGWMLHYLTSERLAESKMLLLTAGTVIFSAGVSMYLNLSPLLVNFIMGVTLANLPSFAHGRITSMLLSTEKPFFVVFMILIGAMWPPISISIVCIALMYIVFRAIGLYIGSFCATAWFYPGEKKPLHIGLAMLTQGGSAMALAVDFSLIYPGPLARFLLSVVLLAIVANQLIGPPFMMHIMQTGNVKPTDHLKTNEIDNSSPAQGATP